MGSNIILYGPPGTGKTYNVVGLAYLAAHGLEPSKENLDNFEEVTGVDRSKARDWYREQLADQNNGQVAFTTFHQSYGYEEFIEGIRPVISKDESADSGDSAANTEPAAKVKPVPQQGLAYEYTKGIFKSFCERARDKYVREAKIWLVNLFERSAEAIFGNAIESKRIRHASTLDERKSSSFPGKDLLAVYNEDLQPGDLVIYGRDKDNSKIVGIITGASYKKNTKDGYVYCHDTEWLTEVSTIDVAKFGFPANSNDLIQLAAITLDDLRVHLSLLNTVDDYETLIEQNVKTKDVKPLEHVFVIDEINRGNISKIFGELITLIESSKRLGQEEEQTAILPYTGDPFGVPNNVTIIGTMNTADHSIATMDNALRRRFDFIEMMPDYNALKDSDGNDIVVTFDKGEVNVRMLLMTLNQRIEYFTDREYQIGQAYFMDLKNNPKPEALANIMRNKVVPLLQEYFFNDYEKICEILGDVQKKDEPKFIDSESLSAEKLGIASEDQDTKPVYTINKDAFIEFDAYTNLQLDL